MKLKIIMQAAALFLTAAAISCSGSQERKQEDNLALEMGRTQALELVKVISRDTLQAEMLIMDVRAREAELRRRGAPAVADSYISSFIRTLDSVAPELAAELQR